MFFDDRLATVLRQRATSDAGARTQFRQLLDILGNRKFASADNRSQSLIAAAWLRMSKLAEDIPAADRARIVREPGWRFRSADLAAHLADQEPEIASAALERAQLTSEDWKALIPRLPVRARGFLRLRKDLPVDAENILDRLGVHDRGLPRPEGAETEAASSAPYAATEEADVHSDLPEELEDLGAPGPVPAGENTDPGRSEISALVERIAQFRRTRDLSPTDTERSPRLPLGDVSHTSDRRIKSFGFTADAAGRINWAESEVAPMVIGTRLGRPPVLGGYDDETAFERSFTRRQPISAAMIELSGAAAIAGKWIIDAQPDFDDDGSFSGYLGRFRRDASDWTLSTAAAREADRIRQLLHELRTPVTAVQGYAEVIQQQLFGPAPHDYRALAAAIAADAARILSGFESLDRLARLETGAIEIEKGSCDLVELVERTVRQIGQVLGARMSGIDFEAADLDEADSLIAVDPEEAEAVIWRLLATLGGACASGELLHATIEAKLSEAVLSCELPAALIAEDDIFTADIKPATTAINSGLFGAGFSLRLARAEARAAGGSLIVEDEVLRLALPLLTAQDAALSQSG